MKPKKMLNNLNLFEKNSFLKVKFFTSFLTFLILASCQDQISEFSLNLEKGKYYHQKIDVKTTMEDRDMSVSWDISFFVKAIHDSYYDMEVKYEKLTTDIPAYGKMVFSSAKNDEEDILSRVLAELTNKPFSIKMGKNGRIRETNINDSLFARIFDKFPELSGLPKSYMEIQIKGAYNEEAFKSNIEKTTTIFPDKPVSKGDKWLINTKSGAGMNLNVETTYELKDITRSYYKIYGESKAETADKDTYVESFGSFGSPTKTDMKGTMISEIMIDRKSGWIIEGKINFELQGGIYMKGPENSDELQIPMNSKSEIVIKGK